ncbi:hypothetical protein Tco_1274321 [Tanacetum coccineum]
MDDPNITMEEYIRLEEEKAQRQGRTFDWQTARYGKTEYYENEDDSFTNLKIEYPAIVFDDISDAAFSREPTISPLDNNEIDFNISFDESDDEDYMIVDGYDEGLTDGMRQTLEDKLSVVYAGDDGHALFTSHAWKRFFELGGARRRITWRQDILALGLHSEEEMAEPGFRAYWYGSERGEEKVIGFDLFYLQTMDYGTANVPYLLAQYLFRHAEGRKGGTRLSEGHFIGCLASHFGLVGDQGLRGLSVVSPRLESQQVATAGTLGAAEDAPATDEGAQAVPAPVQAPQPLLPAPQPQTISITEQTRVFTWMISCMTQLMDVSGRTYQAFDSTLVGSSRLSYERHVRPITGDASTSTAPHTDDYPDP